MSAARRIQTRQSLCRRLHHWALARILRRRIRKLEIEVANLRSWLRQDQFILEFSQRQGLDVTVPLSRMRDEGARLRDLTYAHAQAVFQLQHIEASA